jgi:DNA polymerase III delta prime subunit
VDVIRTKIIDFCSTMSIEQKLKVVLLDEADRLSQAAQDVLRPVMEQFSSNSRFILTGNNLSGISEALQSRCTSLDFSIKKTEIPKLATAFMKRVKFILDNEGVTYDEKVIAALISKHFPNYRKIVNELQRYAGNGTIDVGILDVLSNDSINTLIRYMKEKKFTDCRKWISENFEYDHVLFIRALYDNLLPKIENSSIPDLVTILADRQYKMNFVGDKEIAYTATLVEIMANVRFV